MQATLRHAVEALMLEENAAVPGLQPAVGRLANALVAVLGPELTLGSPAYCSCRALIREMQAGPLAPSLCHPCDSVVWRWKGMRPDLITRLLQLQIADPRDAGRPSCALHAISVVRWVGVWKACSPFLHPRAASWQHRWQNAFLPLARARKFDMRSF